jgi:hypothetical protein
MMAVCGRLCGCLLLLLRSVGVGGDEVFEIQERPGWLRPIAGGSMATRFSLVLRLSHGFGFNCQQESRRDVRDVLGHAPVHDLALS